MACCIKYIPVSEAKNILQGSRYGKLLKKMSSIDNTNKYVFTKVINQPLSHTINHYIYYRHFLKMIASALHITYYESPVGWLEIKADEDAVHALLFVKTGKNSDNISLRNNPVENIPTQQCITQLHEYFKGNRKTFDFPFNQEGTAFQLKVWHALTDIPFGKTISYLELSKRIGDTKAIRAVGTTNGKNQLAIVVPCHRVIGSNGTLVGYAGELWRKKWLLDHEAKYGNGVQTLGGW